MIKKVPKYHVEREIDANRQLVLDVTPHILIYVSAEFHGFNDHLEL